MNKVADKTIHRIDAMRCGDFAKAWQISNRFLSTHHTRKGPRHEKVCLGWQMLEREACPGALLPWSWRHDSVHQIRTTAEGDRNGGDCLAQPSLIPLLRHVAGIDQLLPLHDGVPDVDYDVDLEITELPFVFRTALASIPAVVPYIQIEPAILPEKKRSRIGLIWQSGDRDERRSVPFSEIRRLSKLTQIE